MQLKIQYLGHSFHAAHTNKLEEFIQNMYRVGYLNNQMGFYHSKWQKRPNTIYILNELVEFVRMSYMEQMP